MISTDKRSSLFFCRITFHRAKTLATQYKIVDILHPLFVDNPSNYLYASPIHHAHHHSHAAAAAAAGIAGLPPAGSASTPAGSRIDSGFSSSTASGPSGAFRHTGGLAAAAGTESHHHHHHHHPSSSSPFQPPHQGKFWSSIYIIIGCITFFLLLQAYDP